jgi:hypothetical protein
MIGLTTCPVMFTTTQHVVAPHVAAGYHSALRRTAQIWINSEQFLIVATVLLSIMPSRNVVGSEEVGECMYPISHTMLLGSQRCPPLAPMSRPPARRRAAPCAMYHHVDCVLYPGHTAFCECPSSQLLSASFIARWSLHSHLLPHLHLPPDSVPLYVCGHSTATATATVLQDDGFRLPGCTALCCTVAWPSRMVVYAMVVNTSQVKSAAWTEIHFSSSCDTYPIFARSTHHVHHSLRWRPNAPTLVGHIWHISEYTKSPGPAP